MKVVVDLKDLQLLYKLKEEHWKTQMSKLNSIGFNNPVEFLETESSFDFDRVFVSKILGIKILELENPGDFLGAFEAVGSIGYFSDRPKNEVYTFEEFFKDWK